MSFFDFLKVRTDPKEKKPNDQSPIIEDLALEAIYTLRVQFVLLQLSKNGIPPLVQERTDEGYPIVDLWLAGYISGFYDALCQCRAHTLDLNTLERLYSTFYGREDAAAAIHEYHIVRMSLEADREAACLFGFDEFEDGMMAGGNDIMDWVRHDIEYPLGIYKEYTNPSLENTIADRPT